MVQLTTSEMAMRVDDHAMMSLCEGRMAHLPRSCTANDIEVVVRSSPEDHDHDQDHRRPSGNPHKAVQ